MKHFTDVKDVLDITSNTRLWYYILGFRGYELSNDGYIRSMKHYRKYPFGILIQPKTDKHGNIIHPEDPSYELSNNRNERVCIRLSQIRYIISHNDIHVQGYPRKTIISNPSSRTQRIFITREEPGFKTRTFYPQFNIIKEQEEELAKNPFAELWLPQVTSPIEFDESLIKR